MHPVITQMVSYINANYHTYSLTIDQIRVLRSEIAGCATPKEALLLCDLILLRLSPHNNLNHARMFRLLDDLCNNVETE